MCAFEGAGDSQEQMFIRYSADELEPDGETGGSEAARKGDGGHPGEIGRAVQAQQQCSSGVVLFVDARSFFVDERRRDRSGWTDNSVDAGRARRPADSPHELIASSHTFQTTHASTP